MNNKKDYKNTIREDVMYSDDKFKQYLEDECLYDEKMDEKHCELCEDCFLEGIEEGYNEGHEEGFREGCRTGYEKAKKEVINYINNKKKCHKNKCRCKCLCFVKCRHCFKKNKC